MDAEAEVETEGGSVDFEGAGLGGAEERVRPGWSKGEGSEEVLQQLPILVGMGCRDGEAGVL